MSPDPSSTFVALVVVVNAPLVLTLPMTQTPRWSDVRPSLPTVKLIVPIRVSCDFAQNTPCGDYCNNRFTPA
jgi:hypothetical protein